MSVIACVVRLRVRVVAHARTHLRLLRLVNPRRPVDEHVWQLLADHQPVPMSEAVLGLRDLHLEAAARHPPSAVVRVDPVQQLHRQAVLRLLRLHLDKSRVVPNDLLDLHVRRLDVNPDVLLSLVPLDLDADGYVRFDERGAGAATSAVSVMAMDWGEQMTPSCVRGRRPSKQVLAAARAEVSPVGFAHEVPVTGATPSLSRFMLSLLPQPSLALPFVRSAQKDNCIFSCRYRAALRLPSWRPPLSLVPCAVPESLRQRCSMRNNTIIRSSSDAARRPRFVFVLTTFPGRGQRLVQSVKSLRQQRGSNPAERIIVSAARQFRRSNISADADLARLNASLHGQEPAQPAVETMECENDDGPGTKLLCPLRRLRALASETSDRPMYVLLADDDVTYRSWVLERLDAALTPSQAENTPPAVLAFDVYTLTDVGKAVTGGMHPGLLVSSGHAVVAIRLDVLEGIEAYFKCVVSLEPRAALHDDVWLSMFLQDVKGVLPIRFSGTPFEMASRLFPDSHSSTYSFRSPGALNLLDGSAAEAARRNITGRDKEFHAAVSRAANASNVDRAAVNVAMANVRRRILLERLCGVRANATMCVGAWCNASKPREWGAHYTRVPSWP